MSLESSQDSKEKQGKKNTVKNINGKNYYMNYFMK
jgi:hypothetical protein